MSGDDGYDGESDYEYSSSHDSINEEYLNQFIEKDKFNIKD